MKRKLILSITLVVMILAAVFALSACNRSATPQGQLSNFLIDHNKEYFEYDVKTVNISPEGYEMDDAVSIGVLKVTVTAYPSGAQVNCPDAKTVEKGVLVESELDVNYDSKHLVYNTGCYFNLVNGSSLMVPTYTYRVEKENDVETFRMTGNYQGSTFNYEKKVSADDPTDGSIKLSGTYFDNNEFHQALRTVSTFSTSFNMSFVIPLVSETENSSASLTASCSKVVNVKTAYTASIPEYVDAGVECYKVSVSRSTKVAGLSQILYYSKNNLKAQNATEFTMRNVLVEIHEPVAADAEKTAYIYYCLKTARIPA